MIKIGDKVHLDSDKSYQGIVTKIKDIWIWLDGNITGFPIERWVKSSY